MAKSEVKKVLEEWEEWCQSKEIPTLEYSYAQSSIFSLWLEKHKPEILAGDLEDGEL